METPKQLVGQKNDFIQKTVYKELNINDLKVFKAIVSKINYKDTLFDDFYTLDYNVLDLAGVNKNNRFNIVSAALKKLSGTFVKIKNEKGDTVELGLIKNKFVYEKGTTKIVVEVDEDLQPYLLDLKNKYTKYELENIKKFDNVYTLQIYELLKSWESKGSFIHSLEQLKEYLNIPQDKYNPYNNFKRKILDKAFDQINSETDIFFSIEEIKVGRKVEKLRFIIMSKNDEVVEKDLTALIDKVFVGKDKNKYLVLAYEKDKGSHKYKYKRFNIVKQEITYTPLLEKDELFDSVLEKIKVSEMSKKVSF